MKNIILGCHIGLSKENNYFFGAVQQAISYDANALMIYTGAPQSSYRIPVDKMLIAEGLELLQQQKIPFECLVVHAPYIMNIASLDNQRRLQSQQLLLSEAIRTKEFSAKYLVFHPGNFLEGDLISGINNIAFVLNEIISLTKNTVFTLETMPGKGTQIGKTFKELKMIIDLIKDKARVAVCLDTCHINDAGYDIHNVDDVISEFDQQIGLNFLKVLHLNDSKGERYSKKDLHENIGYGSIGFETLSKWANHPMLGDVIKILETPLFNGQSVYSEEIKMLRNKKWVDHLKNK